MKAQNKSLENKLLEYLSTRNEYLSNALELVGKGKLRKASELLWGAIALQIKLLALAKKNLKLATHKDLRVFMRQLAKELGDPQLYKTFQLVERLHTNFYDEILDPEDFNLYLQEALKLIKKLEQLLKHSHTTQSSHHTKNTTNKT